MEHNIRYQTHMEIVRHMRYGVDTSPPEISPRHRLIAQRAAARRKKFLKNARATVKAMSRMMVNQSAYGTPRAFVEVDPYASPMFPSRAPAVSPQDLNFLLSYGHNQSQSQLSSARSARPPTCGTSRREDTAVDEQGLDEEDLSDDHSV
jgi:hypothetical protein